MPRILITGSGFGSDEINLPKRILEWSGHAVKIAAPSRSKITSTDGSEFAPDLAFYEINPDYFDAIIVVGKDAEGMSTDRNLTGLLRKMALKGKVVGGITMGPLALAAAGLLTGKRATVFPEKNAIRELKESNAKYEQRHVVCDGNVITGDDPESAEELVREIIKILG